MKKLLAVDGNSILNRAYYGVRMLTNVDGFPTNALFGMVNILTKQLEALKPDYLAVAFDLKAPTFRHKMYSEYKAGRKPMPDELALQLPVAKDLCHAMGFRVLELEGYEADDILGTLAKRAQKDGLSVTILSGDRDILQIADENIKISVPKTTKGHTEVFNYYPEDVKAEYQVTPLEFIDLKGLMGDSSDNIPGLPGVGDKTATEIIKTFHSIENANAHLSEIKPPKAQKAFAEHFDLAVLSKKLATIDIDAPLEADIRKGKAGKIYTEEAIAILRDLELKTLVKKFSERKIAEPEASETKAQEIPAFRELDTREEAEKVFEKAILSERIGLSFLRSVTGGEEKQLSLFDTESEEQIFTAFGLSLDGKDIVLVKSSDSYPGENLRADLRQFLLRLSGREKPAVCVLGAKKLLKELPELKETGLRDISIAAYLLNPLRDSYGYDDIAKDYAGLLLKSSRELLMKGEAYSPELLSLEAYVPDLTADAVLGKLSESGMQELYDTIEMPLVFTLNDMENAGIKVDRDALSGYAAYLSGLIKDLEEKICEAAGEKFNINSPIQLGNILFEKMGLKGGKKTKRGYSTAADVLEKLAPDHEIVRDILSYRTYSKLYSTYAEGLRAYIEEDGRIHGTFNQTVTATGRISSTDPNLQNIPVRTEEGREIRKVFIPEEGYIFTDADYSQVELRILAALSGDEKLISAYRDSVDIHTLTASQVFHVDIDKVTPLLRRNAKAVNFGIVYGISAFGLGEGLSISRAEALSYIDRYFETYPGVKEYLDGCVREAKEKGVVKTLFGRIRPIPELKSQNYMERTFGERVAMNSPIQGTAADIMKIAMNRVAERLRGMKSRIVLQIHDELLIETYIPEAEEVKTILRESMESAADLSVKLVCEIETGENWNTCH